MQKLDRRVFIILIIQITEVLGFSLILPFLPFYAQKLGASAFEVGLMLTCFSLFQFFSAPIMGKLSDKYGRKPLLILSQISTFISFLILAAAGNLWMLFLSRAVDGILGSNMSIAQAYLADISTKKNRSQTLAISGVAFGFGFLVGPALGGFLSQINYAIPSLLAALASLMTIFLTYFLLPETINKNKLKKIKFDLKIFEIDEIILYFKNSEISPKLLTYFSYVLTHAIYVSSFALFAQGQVGANAQSIGYFMTYIGLISIILRAKLMGILIQKFGENKLKFFGVLMMIVALFLASFASNWPLLILAMTGFAVGTGLSRPILTAEVSRSTNENKQGEVMGVLSSLQSVAQIFGPLIGGYLIQNFFPGSMSLAASLTIFIGFVLMLYHRKHTIKA